MVPGGPPGSRQAATLADRDRAQAFLQELRGFMPSAASAISGPAPRLGVQPWPVAVWYCSTTLAGMRPRSLTAMPWSFAQARMSPER